MPTISNRNRSPKHTQCCFIYNDTAALRDAHKQIKAMRRGQTINICMMSHNALEDLMSSYSNFKYEIEGHSIDDYGALYEVNVHRYTFFEQLRAKRTHQTPRPVMSCSVSADCEW